MRTVVALGGNAITARDDRGTASEMRARIRGAADELAALISAGHELIITHGNGPQVGRLLLQDEALPEQLPRYPLDVHVAATQGQLGYLLQSELSAALKRVRSPRSAVTIVDAGDPAFTRPAKPIGPHLSAKGAAEYRARGIEVAAAPGGGWRRVVPSPEPVEVVERDAIVAAVDAKAVPIVAGGGGVPVVREGGGLRGVAAVVDKDRTAALLARSLEADLLLILTNVPGVMDGYGPDAARVRPVLPPAEARAGVEDGSYPRGSMAEKVLAAADVAEAGGRAIIAGLGSALEALDGRTGTVVAS